MNPLQPSQNLLQARVLVVGVGGLGSPAAKLLARSGVGHLTLVDDDVVDVSNLHRQTLYNEKDAGRPKVEVAAKELKQQSTRCGFGLTVDTHQTRVLPDTALRFVDSHDLVLEGGDNFATKFMMADACHIAQKPLVQAGVVRWNGWTLGYSPSSQTEPTACLRCIFEDIPRDQPETCSEAGVIGPVVGVLAAIQAAIALRLLRQATAKGPTAAGRLHTYRGLLGELRSSKPLQNPHCPLCAGEITTMNMARYLPPECAA